MRIEPLTRFRACNIYEVYAAPVCNPALSPFPSSCCPVVLQLFTEEMMKFADKASLVQFVGVATGLVAEPHETHYSQHMQSEAQLEACVSV